ncbi:MAG: DNA alkylation repair protein [Bacteroidales bacterium]|nr:DNA alkylation repair protein [Bacteroidales bacterium]
MTELIDRLFELQDKDYAAFQAKLTPGIAPEKFIGVRVPILRSYAKDLFKRGGYEDFLLTLPHQYYDENMLHALLISQMKDMEACVAATDAFLPYVDNWAVCDIMSPKIFAKHKPRLMEKIEQWSISDHTYTCRFGLEMLMTHFLDADFKPEYLHIVADARSDEYYVKMMVAWFFATALAKQWDAALPFVEKQLLSPWTHNKTIQKARESFRITAEQKEYLSKLKISK